MRFHLILQGLCAGLRLGPAAQRPAKLAAPVRHELRCSFRPNLDVLEDRTLLSLCTVDRLTDLGEGKGPAGDLRYCLTQVQDGDTVRFSVQGTIGLTSALPTLDRSLAIEGPGANQLTVRRLTGGNYRILTVAAGATVNLSGLTLTGGLVTDGSGGGIANAGTLTVVASTITGNSASPAMGPANGGGIANSGTLTIVGSTVSGNTATADGFANGGGIFNTGSLTIVSSTLSGNTASARGNSRGGGVANSGTLTIVSSTITGNSALALLGGSGGGIAGTANLRSTILAGNRARSSGPDLSGTLASSGFNLIGNTLGGSGFRRTDLLNVDPRLGPLADNGGPTLTHALLPDSPAIDAGHPKEDPSGFDQRGEGFARLVGGRIDIGAFEVQGEGDSAPAPQSAPRGSTPKPTLDQFATEVLARSAEPSRR